MGDDRMDGNIAIRDCHEVGRCDISSFWQEDTAAASGVGRASSFMTALHEALSDQALMAASELALMSCASYLRPQIDTTPPSSERCSVVNASSIILSLRMMMEQWWKS